jgi:branched-subunit amino acid permease
MVLTENKFMFAGVAVALLAILIIVKKKGGIAAAAADAGQALGGAAAAAAGGVVAGAAEGIGDQIGIPRTSMTECEKAKAEGRTLDASFACPAGDFLGYINPFK